MNASSLKVAIFYYAKFPSLFCIFVNLSCTKKTCVHMVKECVRCVWSHRTFCVYKYQLMCGKWHMHSFCVYASFVHLGPGEKVGG